MVLRARRLIPYGHRDPVCAVEIRVGQERIIERRRRDERKTRKAGPNEPWPDEAA